MSGEESESESTTSFNTLEPSFKIAKPDTQGNNLGKVYFQKDYTSVVLIFNF